MIRPGLQRIARLVENAEYPWKAIHVAGTNGKGSICCYASAMLTRRLIPNGRFVSPHLIHRWDCITINDRPVEEQLFRKVEDYFIQLNNREGIQATNFEILTATAFEIFNRQKVEVGVVEVGMGGTLDATNILNNQIVSVLSVIARDHENFLGPTLEDIARHKAGILRPKVPYIVNPINEWNVHHVIEEYAAEIGAGPRIRPDAPIYTTELFKSKDWAKFAQPLHSTQRDNGVLGYLAYVEALKSLNLSTKKARGLLPHMKRKRLDGRMQRVKMPAIFGDRVYITVDGAHNENAARALRGMLDRGKLVSRDDPIRTTWVLAMTDGKDAYSFLSSLLRPGDSVVTTQFGPVDGMPWVKPMDPQALLRIAQSAQWHVSGLFIPQRGALRALCAARHFSPNERIVLTGSLYLVGDLMREMEAYKANPGSFSLGPIDREERRRVNDYFKKKARDAEYSVQEKRSSTADGPTKPEIERKRLSDEINSLDQELAALEQEEQRLLREHRLGTGQPESDANNMLTARIPVFDSLVTWQHRINRSNDSQDEPVGSEDSLRDDTAPKNDDTSNKL